MDTLPFELLTEILNYLSHSHAKTVRLTCRSFNTILAKPTFNILASFIDPDVALLTLETLAGNLQHRPRAIWSPSCSVPKGLPIPESFLLAMYVALCGTSWLGRESRQHNSWPAGRGCSDSEEGDDMEDGGALGRITAQNFGRLIGREDITEDKLRQALFRYSLYLSYTYEGRGEAPQLWVMNKSHWEGRL